MAKLSDIASVIIDLRTASIAKASFGIPAIMAETAKIPAGEARVYTELPTGTAVLEDDIMAALQVMFSQEPRVAQVVVGSLAMHDTGTVTVTVPSGGFASGDKVGFTLNGVKVEASATSSTSDIDVISKLLQTSANTALGTDYTLVWATDSGTTKLNGSVSIVAKDPVATPRLTFTAPQNVATAVMRETTGDISTQLGNIQGYNNSWYGFTILNATSATLIDASAWAEAADPAVMHWAASTDSAIWSTPAVVGQVGSDVLSQLKSKQYNRTALVPSKNADPLDAVAAMSRFFTGEPGSIIAGLKTLVGITPSNFTPTELKNIQDKNGNYYTQYANNVYLFNPGKAVSGRWLDEVRDRDWLINYIQTEYVSAMMRSPKIPYTAAGVTVMENVLRGCLVRAQQMGVIAPDQINSLGATVPGFQVTVPNIFDISFDDKAKRVLRLPFVALLAGAIQQVEVRGVLTYNYEGV